MISAVNARLPVTHLSDTKPASGMPMKAPTYPMVPTRVSFHLFSSHVMSHCDGQFTTS